MCPTIPVRKPLVIIIPPLVRENLTSHAENKAIGVMKPGHSFTIEPMINQGNSWDKTLLYTS